MSKNVALVLSSGGARGLAHIGAILELEAQGYTITSIAGCSMGALIGGVYAVGKLDEFREWMTTIDKKRMFELTDFSLSLNHLAKGMKIIQAIMEFVPDEDIERLPLPYCAVATDWSAGQEVVFRTGSMFDAIRASISLPSFFEPVHRNGRLLIDGGVINPIPLNRVARTEGDMLVGIDVSGHDYEGQTVAHFNYYTMLSRVSSLMIRQNSILMAQLTHPDVLVDIQMSNYGTFDFDKSEELIEIGRQETRQALEAL